jgi:hypothetical protein
LGLADVVFRDSEGQRHKDKTNAQDNLYDRHLPGRLKALNLIWPLKYLKAIIARDIRKLLYFLLQSLNSLNFEDENRLAPSGDVLKLFLALTLYDIRGSMAATPVPLSYSIAASTPHSGPYRVENILVDNPTEQASRWSGGNVTEGTPQWLLLRLDTLAVVR